MITCGHLETLTSPAGHYSFFRGDHAGLLFLSASPRINTRRPVRVILALPYTRALSRAWHARARNRPAEFCPLAESFIRPCLAPVVLARGSFLDCFMSSLTEVAAFCAVPCSRALEAVLQAARTQGVSSAPSLRLHHYGRGASRCALQFSRRGWWITGCVRKGLDERF